MALIEELNEALRLIDADKEIGAIVINELEKAYAGVAQPSQALACPAFGVVSHTHSRKFSSL